MKMRMVLSVGLFFLAVMPLRAQDKKTMNCDGVIAADGQSFTCDKDKKVWKVSNPASLNDMEGQHAKLTFHRTAAADEVFVNAASVSQAPTVARKDPGDAAFRR
jgi:hypothetical protein